jgi:LmbE family N-acetylglucosaminyl deacetylase
MSQVDLFNTEAMLVALAAGIGLTGLMKRMRGSSAAVSAPRRVLAVGAHPDDIEFGCGATLLRYREAGFACHGLVLTRGEHGLASGRFHTDHRVAEAQRGARQMKLDTLDVLTFPDGLLASRRDAVKQAIELAVVQFGPEIVLTHNRLDVHSDHRMVHAATLEASRNVPTVLCYENPNSPPEFRPTFFVDVDGFVDGKIRALRAHSSQRSRDYFNPELIRGLARMRGRQARLVFAEAFEPVRIRKGSV